MAAPHGAGRRVRGPPPRPTPTTASPAACDAVDGDLAPAPPGPCPVLEVAAPEAAADAVATVAARWPGREAQVASLARLLGGPDDWPVNIFVHGPASTGKTGVVRCGGTGGGDWQRRLAVAMGGGGKAGAWRGWAAAHDG